MQIATHIEVEQNTQEWYEARTGLITASGMKDVFAGGKGVTREKYAIKLALERLTGERQEGYTNDAMQNGHDTEPVAALAYELSTGSDITECGMFKHDKLPIGASPDRLVDSDGVLQIKSPEPLAHIKYMREGILPYAYRKQCITELWLTGRDWLDFMSFNGDLPANAQKFVVRLWRRDVLEEIDEIQEGCIEFNGYVDYLVDFIKNYKGV